MHKRLTKCCLPDVIYLPGPKGVKGSPGTTKEKHYIPYQWGRPVFFTAEQRAEYKRAWNYFYNRRPEIRAAKKAYMAAWRQIPEVKVYEKAYRDAYRADPEVRKRDNALRKLRHARRRQERGNNDER